MFPINTDRVQTRNFPIFLLERPSEFLASVIYTHILGEKDEEKQETLIG